MALPACWCQFSLFLHSPQKPAFWNVFYFVPNAPPVVTDPLTDAQTLADDIVAQLCNDIAGVLTTDSYPVGGRLILHYMGQPYVVNATSLVIAGTIIGDELPDFVAAVIQKRTPHGGKSGRGRWYVGPVPEGLTNENVLDGGGKSAYQLVADDWKAPVASLGADWVPNLHSTKDATMYPLASTHANELLGSMRGRKSNTLT